ncbi:MAG: hypothetical protein Q8J99_16970 [Sulfuritalea sp.]|nr:hypothetical protein [Sulfuritalea sp.]
MWQRLLLRLLVALSAIVSISGVLWMSFAPPPGMKATKDGVPYFTPPVVHPVTGQPVPVEILVQHYKGAK